MFMGMASLGEGNRKKGGKREKKKERIGNMKMKCKRIILIL
jgi:hypothetical protein